MPKVSVVMPSLNVRPYIEECMDSVLNQMLRDIEILCVDAGSTDGTLEILRRYEGEDSRVRVIVSDKKSYGYQMNLGLGAATGEYFGIVETDDYVAREMFAELYEVACREDLDVVKGSFYRFCGEGKERTLAYAPIAEDRLCGRLLDSARNPSVIDRRSIYSWAGIYKRSFLLDKEIWHNETPGASYQDNGFWFQVFSQAHRVKLLKKPYYYLRRDNLNSSFHAKDKVYCICEEYDFIRQVLKKDPALEKRFAPYCALYRYLNYDFSLRRIADEYRRAFLRRFSEDFKLIEEEGELLPALFSPEEWSRLRSIMDDPDRVYFEQAPREVLFPKSMEELEKGEELKQLHTRLRAAEALLQRAEKEQQYLRRSTTFRVGAAMLWLPRKLRDATLCLKSRRG